MINFVSLQNVTGIVGEFFSVKSHNLFCLGSHYPLAKCVDTVAVLVTSELEALLFSVLHKAGFWSRAYCIRCVIMFIITTVILSCNILMPVQSSEAPVYKVYSK